MPQPMLLVISILNCVLLLFMIGVYVKDLYEDYIQRKMQKQSEMFKIDFDYETEWADWEEEQEKKNHTIH